MKHASHDAPTARWILGVDTEHDQEYLVHTDVPAFIAKVSSDDEEGILSGFSYALSDGRSLYDFIWFDAVPAETEMRELLAAAELAVLRVRPGC